ncbi:hypothetical protein ACFLRC_02555 [Candidatus Altiarchaeota archaeon]
MKNKKGFVLWILLSLVLLSSSAQAYITDPHIEERLKIAGNFDVGAIATADIDGDGLTELFVGYVDNTVKVFDSNGEVVKQFNAGRPSEFGKIRALEVEALQVDGKLKVLVGFAGRHVEEEVDSPEYINVNNVSMQRVTNRLIRRVRNEGGVAAYSIEGVREWFYYTENGVQDLFVANLDVDPEMEIVAGIGELSSLVYNKKTGTDDNNIDIWEDIEYFYRNGSVLALNDSGGLVWRHNVTEKGETGYFENLDYNIHCVLVDDINGDGKEVNVIVGSDNGYIYIMNQTGGLISKIEASESGIFDVSASDLEGFHQKEIISVSSDNHLRVFESNGKLLWAYKFRSLPEVIVSQDIDYDETIDLIVGSLDGFIYVLNSSGTLQWKYRHTESIYDFIIDDLDGDENAELSLKSLNNITVLELRKEYVMRKRGEGYYFKARKFLDREDLFNAKIYAHKARDIFLEINDELWLHRVGALVDEVNSEWNEQVKIKADHLYDKAVKAYGLDNYEESLQLITQAQRDYREINDQIGLENTELLEERISREICVKRELEANSLYGKALNFYGYRNMTGSLKLAREAKVLYQNISESCNDSMNDSVEKCDKLISNIALNYYRKAEAYYNSRDYNTASIWIKESSGLYEEVEDSEGSLKAQLLKQKIDSKIGIDGPITDSDWMGDAFFVLVVVAITIILLIIYKRVQRRREYDF